MIGSIRGRLVHKDPARVIVEAGGIGYLIGVPFSTFFQLGEVGAEVELQVHTHVREDALQLFGFKTALELAVFHRLIDVSGIGPRMALNILSGIDARELAQAIRGQDLKRLSSVPGVGKKTAERLVVELKDKLDELLLATAAGMAPALGRSVESERREDVVSALANLGYRRRDAESAVDRVAAASTVTLEQLLKAALAVLAR